MEAEMTYSMPIISGNLPLDIRYRVKNPDGSISTVRTASIGTDQGEVVIPTVIDGMVVSVEDAIRHFEQTGENFGTFANIDDANSFAEWLHNQHAAQLACGNIGIQPAGIEELLSADTGRKPAGIIWPMGGRH